MKIRAISLLAMLVISTAIFADTTYVTQQQANKHCAILNLHYNLQGYNYEGLDTHQHLFQSNYIGYINPAYQDTLVLYKLNGVFGFKHAGVITCNYQYQMGPGLMSNVQMHS